jgi:hypothetical protein
MALATLHDEKFPGCIPHYKISLSSISEITSEPSPAKSSPLVNVYLKSAEPHPVHLLSSQDLFVMFRPCGPLKKVACAVSVDGGHVVSILHFYSDDAVERAHKHLHNAVEENAWPECGLQAYNTTCIRVGVRIYSLNSKAANTDLIVKDLDPTISITELRTCFQRVCNPPYCLSYLTDCIASCIKSSETLLGMLRDGNMAFHDTDGDD